MSYTHTDDFTRANADPISSTSTATWTTASGASANQIVSNAVRPSVTGGGGCHSNYGTGDTFACADQKVTVKTVIQNTPGQTGALARSSNTATTTYMAFSGGDYGATAGFTLAKYVGGSYSEPGAGSTANISSGSLLTCEAIGTTIRGLVNGSQIYSQTDTDISTGHAGIRTFSSGATSDAEVDDFEFIAYAPVFVAAGTEGSAANGNITNTGWPTLVSTNDYVIMAAHTSDQASMLAATTWTKIIEGNGGGTTSRLTAWGHRFDGVNTPSLVISHSAGQSPIAGVAAFRGVTTATTPYVVGTIVGSSNQIIQHTGITPTGDANALLLAINGAADDNDRTIPTGYSTVFEDSGAGTNNAFVTTAGNPDGSVAMAIKDVPISATGTIVVSQAAADAWSSVLLALTQFAVVAAAGNAVPLLRHMRKLRI